MSDKSKKSRGFWATIGHYSWLGIKKVLGYPFRLTLRLAAVALAFGLILAASAPLIAISSIIAIPVLFLWATHKLFHWPRTNPIDLLRPVVQILVATVAMMVLKVIKLAYYEIKYPVKIIALGVASLFKIKHKPIPLLHHERPHITLDLIKQKHNAKTGVTATEGYQAKEDILLEKNNVAELLDYFASDEYKENSRKTAYFGKKIQAKIHQATPGELEKLKQYLLENNIFCLCEYAAYTYYDSSYKDKINLELQTIFDKNKRNFLTKLLHESSDINTNQIQSTIAYDNIRRAKVRLVHGEVQQGQLEFQRKQEVSQQIELEQTTQTLLDLRREQIKNSHAPAPLVIPISDTEKELVNGSNIEDKRYAIFGFGRTTPVSLKNRDDLRHFWRLLVGENARIIANHTNPPISDITIDAMRILAQYPGEFQYGLVLDNLPDGFYLYTREGSQHVVLDYDRNLLNQHRDNPRQLLKITLPEQGHLQDENPASIDSLILDYGKHNAGKIQSANKKIDAIDLDEKVEGLIELLLLNNPNQDGDQLKELLESLSLNNNHDLQALRDTLLTHGAASVLLFLQLLSQLKISVNYDSFKRTFLDRQKNFNSLTTPEAMQQLKALIRWDKSSLHWWESLTESHQFYTGNAVFSELFSAFSYFLHRVKEVGVLLPAPVLGIKHMKVALDRLLLVLDAAIDKKEQITELSGLDFMSEGASYASTEAFKLLTKEMQCSPNIDALTTAKDPHLVEISFTPMVMTSLGIGADTQTRFTFNCTTGITGLLNALREKNANPKLVKYVLDQVEAAQSVRSALFQLLPTSDAEKEFWVNLNTAFAGTEDVNKIGGGGGSHSFMGNILSKGDSIETNQDSFKKTWSGFKFAGDAFDIGLPLVIRHSIKIAEFRRAITNKDYYATLDENTKRVFNQINYALVNQEWLNNGNSCDNDKFTIKPAVNLPNHNGCSALERHYPFSYSTAYRDNAFLTTLINDQDFKINKTYFFRYIGLAPWALPMNFYRELTTLLEQNASIQSPSWRNAQLHLLASLTTTQRQLTKGKDTQFITTLLLQCSHFDTDTLQQFQQSIRNMKEENQPSAQDMVQITYLHAQQENSPAIYELFDLIDTLGPLSYAVIDNAALRKTMSLPLFDPNALLAKLRAMKEMNLGTLPMECEPGLLSYVADIDQATPAEISEFSKRLHDVLSVDGNETLYSEFLRVINTISIQKSKKLPTQVEILRIAEQIRQQYARPQGIDDLARELQLAWPQTYILASYPIESPTVTLLKALSEAFAGLNLAESVKDIPVVGSMLQGPMEALEAWRDRLLLPQVTLADAFDGLEAIEKSIHSALTSVTGFFVQTAIRALNIPFVQEFFEHKTITPLLKAPLELLLHAKYENTLLAIDIAPGKHPGIYNFFFEQLNKIKQIEGGLPVKQALMPFFEILDALQLQLNSLIDVHNNITQAQWQKMLDLLEANSASLTLEQHTQLIALCQQYDSANLVDDLTIFYETLSNPGVEKQRFSQAYLALQGLMPYATRLRKNPEQFKQLLQFTFEHCLKTDTPFPYSALFELHGIDSVDSDTLHKLTETILHYAAKTLEPGNHLKEAVQGIVRLVTKAPTTLTWATQLLGLFEKHDSIDWLGYQQCIEKLASIEQDKQALLPYLSTILTSITVDKAESVNTLIDRMLLLAPEQLVVLRKLFEEKPFPTLNQLMQAIENINTIDAWVEKFDRDPFNARENEQQIQKQFDTSQVIRVIQTIKDIKSDHVLPFAEQLALTKDFAWVNKKGKTLQHLSRLQLKQEAKKAIDAILQKPENTHALLLELLALSREIYYRTTGKFAYSTQIIALLLYLQRPGNLLLQLNTGQGKSIVAPILQFLEWTRGGSINACTANDDLAYRDHESAALFFDFLNLPHQYLDEQSLQGQYALGGINYSRLANASLYRANAKVDHEPMRRITHGVKDPATSLIIDEVDADVLDNHTAFNLALGGSSNPYAWIYPLINEFIDNPQFKNIDPGQGPVWYEDEDILQLKQYLANQVTDPRALDLLGFVSDYQFGNWLDAALTARQHREDYEFIIQQFVDKQGKKIHIAVPLDHNIPQLGSTRENGVQQFLHARLQKEKTDGVYHFPIDDESTKVSSEFTGYYIKRYLRKGGRLIGISATLGNTLELAEESTTYDIQAFSIPSHEVCQRKILGAKIIDQGQADVDQETDQDENYTPLGGNLLNTLVKAMTTVRQESKDYIAAGKGDPGQQPILIICKNINELERYKRGIKSRPEFAGMEVNVVRGDEDLITRAKYIKKAEQKNTITISTSLLGRGTDITPTHPAGLFCIQTYVDNKRTSKQIEGRTARRDQVGYFMCLFEKADGRLMQYHTNSLDQLEALYQKIDEEAAVERYYQQEMDSIQNTVLDFFQHWYKLALNCNPNQPMCQRALLKLREKIIVSFATTWHALLEATDPDKRDANLLIHREADGSLETRSLDECLMALEEHANLQWEDTLKALEKYLPVEQLSDSNNHDQLATYYQKLIKHDLKHALEDRRNERGIIPTQESHDALIPADAQARLVEALNEEKVDEPLAIETPVQINDDLQAICKNLIDALAWHTKKSHVFERTITNEAAKAISAAAQHPTIQSLYQVLIASQEKLKDKWFLGIFHTNIRKAITKALNALDSVAWQEKNWIEARHDAENAAKPSTQLTLEHFAAVKQKELTRQHAGLKLYYHHAGFRETCQVVPEEPLRVSQANASLFYKKASNNQELEQELFEITSTTEPQSAAG